MDVKKGDSRMSDLFRRIISLLLLAAVALSMVAPVPVSARITSDTDCAYDPATPEVEHARESFRSGNHTCARLELMCLLGLDILEGREKADAHALMAAVEYATTFDRKERRQRTRLQFLEAFKAFRYWRGQMEIPEYEFRNIMKDAREVMEWVYSRAEEAEPTEIIEEPAAQVVTEPPIAAVAEKKKPWYQRWWALGSGVGLVVMAVSVLGSAGADEVVVEVPSPAVDTLADFPSPP